MTGNWDELLAENKEKYNNGLITKDEYERNAKRLRRSRRNALRASGETATIGSPSTTKTKTAKKKKAGRKPKVEFTPEMAVVEQTIYDYFKEINLPEEDFIACEKSWHCTHIVALLEVMKSDQDIHPGQLLIDKFKAKWMRDPEFFVSYSQGGIKVFGLGPILNPS